MSLHQFMDDIPGDEIIQFEKFMRVYKAGDVLISEGEPNDNTLYLLRAGNIGIFRKIAGLQEQITEATAIAFLGEMELMDSQSYRYATCSVVSEYAVVYVFKHPDIKTILKNTMWGEILVTRLCQDMHICTDRIVQHEAASAQALRELEYTRQQTAFLLSALESLHTQVACDLVQGRQDWQYVKGIYDLIHDFARVRLPDIYYRMMGDKNTALRQVIEEGLLPNMLKDLLGTKVKPGRG